MSTYTTVAAFLKNHYYLTQNTIPDTTYPESALYAKLPKDTKWGGADGTFPLIYGHNQSVSSTFTTTQTNGGNLAGVKWLVPSSGNKKIYASAKFPTDVIRSMEGNENAYFGHITTETDSAFKTATRFAAFQLFRDGWNDIGRISSLATVTIANDTVVLTDATHSRMFDQSTRVVGAAARTSGVLRSATAAVVVSVDEDAGRITFDRDVTGLTWAANDYLFLEGTRQNVVSPVPLGVRGLEAWIPFDRTTITSTTFFGVDRRLHKTRLAGSYLDGSGMSIQSAIKSMLTTMADRGGQPKMAVCNFQTWSALEAELASKVEYEDVAEAGVGFNSIKIRGPKTTLNVVADNLCQSNRIWLINPDSWKLLSLGKTLGFLDEDSNGPTLRVYNDDSIETRIGGYLEAVCINPVDNAVISTDGA